jgi:hypothetical protein
MAAAAIVRPGGEVVVPLAPEMIRNEQQPQYEGKSRAQKRYEEQKQDCERGAVQRLLEKQGEYYKTLNATLMGDNVYAQPPQLQGRSGQGFELSVHLQGRISPLDSRTG